MPADDLLLTRVLIAIHNPANGCFAPDGDILTVSPRSNIPLRVAIPHYFVSVQNRTLKARYGSVQETEPFTAGEFLRTYCSCASDEEQAHVSEMLRTIQLVRAGESVAVDYVKRGLPPRMELSVHRVFFYGRVRRKER